MPPFGRPFRLTPCGCANIWISRAPPAQSWMSVAWSPLLNLFAAVSLDGGVQQVMTSADGIIWALQNTPIVRQWTCIRWSPGLSLFVALAQDGGANVARSMVSADGVNWVAGNAIAGTPAFQMLAWSPSLARFVGIASSNGTTAANLVFTSSDGLNWAAVAVAVAVWNSVEWSPELNLFAAINSNLGNGVMTSPQGTVWTPIAAAIAGGRSVAWSPSVGIFAAIGTGTPALSSTDGITWTVRATPVANSWEELRWFAGRGVFQGIGAAASLLNVISTEDGINYIGSNGAANNVYQGLDYSPSLDRIVAVSSNGANRVMTNG